MQLPIAERELTLKRPDGTEQAIRVLLWKPEFRHERGWEVDFEIRGPGGEVTRSHGSGLDAFQALYGALHMIPILMDGLSVLGQVSAHEDDWHWFPAIPQLTKPTPQKPPSE
ncbi:DUF6968 family protein [Sorangium sp. So ce854]|uniref:DUF6968 family protein n=1 Tax=Sorangium sp. So ce854 TaxID=3133322 RepID=UPI003F5DA909